MSFTKKKLIPKDLYVIDIGSHRIRISACQFFNGKIKILDHLDHRQNSDHFKSFINLSPILLAEELKRLIHQLENKNDFFIRDVVINFPTGNVYAQSRKVTLNRIYPDKPITEQELEEIIYNTQVSSITTLINKVGETYTLSKEQLRLILSRINQSFLNGKPTRQLEGKKGSTVDISILNIFVEKIYYDMISRLGSMIDKDIIHILPSEYTISKLTSKPSAVIINIGAHQTKISIKKEYEILGINRIAIGMNDLIHKIKERHSKLTRQQILDQLPEHDSFSEEKQFFTDIWKESLAIAIKEIVGDEICPNNFCVYGGGNENNFLIDAISQIDFFGNNIKIILPTKSIDLEANHENRFYDTDMEIIQNLNQNQLSIILEASSLISKEKQELSRFLQKTINALGYDQ